jgi:hypothetical protein
MTKFKVKGLRGLCPDALKDSSRFKVQGSRFSDLKVQSDPRVDDKVINDYEL